MMIVRLFCPSCALEATKSLPHAVIDVPTPVAALSDDDRYEVRCQKGHVNIVFLNNLKFELLFELGLNALVDGYPRESVSSFASALERFYEFYWHVFVAKVQLSEEEAANAWRALSKQSERQLGMYITAHTVLTKRCPLLLNPNTEVRFRNNVIHGGYVPNHQEAVNFGDKVMFLINSTLDDLRREVPEAVAAAHSRLLLRPSSGEDELIGSINVLTAVDVKCPPTQGDIRLGGVEAQFERILRDRQPHGFELLSKEEFEKKALSLGPSSTDPG